MSDFPELTKLPDHDDYWLALERRVIEHSVAARDPLAGRWVGWLGLAGAAAVATLILMPARPTQLSLGSIGYLRLPDEAALFAAPSPPPVGAFILLEPAPNE